MAGNTVWLLILRGRSFGVEVKVFASQDSAVHAGVRAMQEELEHRHLEKPEEETIKHGSEQPYYAYLEDSLYVRVARAEVLA